MAGAYSSKHRPWAIRQGVDVGGDDGQVSAMQTTVGMRSAPGPGNPAAVLIAGLEVPPRQNADTCSGVAGLAVPVRLIAADGRPLASVAPRQSRVRDTQLSPVAGQSALLPQDRNDSRAQT